MSREIILAKVRTALGRTPGQPPSPAPLPLISSRTIAVQDRVASFIERFQNLAGKAILVPDPPAAAKWVGEFLHGKTGLASNSPYLAECGITQLPNVETGLYDPASVRAAAAIAGAGITSLDYALADTGSMVMLASPKEARLISLLPPVHIAVFPKSSILSGLDELFTLVPEPAQVSSSMVLITGPSRTADIEQILVRGVHGPGEIYAIIVDR